MLRIDRRDEAEDVVQWLRAVQPVAMPAAFTLGDGARVCLVGRLRGAPLIAPRSRLACVLHDVLIHDVPYPHSSVCVRERTPDGLELVGEDGTVRMNLREARLRFDTAPLLESPDSSGRGQRAEENTLVLGQLVVAAGWLVRDGDTWVLETGALSGHPDDIGRAGYGGAIDVLRPVETRVAPVRSGQFMTSGAARIDQLRHGAIATVRGAVRAVGDLLRAPASGRPCVFFAIAIHAAPYAVRSPVAHVSSQAPFWIADGSGRAVVDPERGGKVALGEPEARVAPFALPTVIAELAARHGATSVGWIEEHVIGAGERVEVTGHVLLEPDPDGADRAVPLRAGPPMRARIVGGRDTPLSFRPG